MGISDSAAAPVSVVIPCYRCAATVARAVESVLAQTRQAAEILLVDDGSDDDTGIVLRSLSEAAGRPGIRVISLAGNLGPGAARNAGWEAAAEPWIAFLDADDVWHSRKIELQFGWLERSSGVDLCAHDSAAWGQAGEAPVSDVGTPFRIDPRMLLARNVIPTRSVMLRRALPARFGGKDVTEDYLLWLELGLSGHGLWKLPVALAYSFRPEFSPGGYSGELWTHEKRELRCLRRLRERRLVGRVAYLGASALSLAKFLRRRWIVGSGR